MFRIDHQLAWSFHRNTSRWPYNVPPVPDTHSAVSPYKEYAGLPTFELPDVELPDQAFRDLVNHRYSCRSYKNQAISLAELSLVLRTGYGVNRVSFLGDMEFLERPVPSGGGLYPLELYVLVRSVEGLEPGVYHYAVLPAMLEQIRAIELPPVWISRLFMNQSYITNCSAIVLTTAVVERNMWKYGDRGYRYVLYEAGHVVQNMNLTALSLNLGTVNLGGFFDDEVCSLLAIDNNTEIPLYGMALGHPVEQSINNRRMPDDRTY